MYIYIKKSISGNIWDSSTVQYSFDTFHSKAYFTQSIFHIIISGYFGCGCNIQPMTESRAQTWLSISHTQLTIKTFKCNSDAMYPDWFLKFLMLLEHVRVVALPKQSIIPFPTPLHTYRHKHLKFTCVCTPQIIYIYIYIYASRYSKPTTFTEQSKSH